jgi:DNA-binding NarL/FixJ family response regulator
MIRVLLAEDQALVRQALETLLNLSPDIRVIAHATDGEETLLRLRECSPEVLLLDVRMPKMSGIDVLRELKQRSGAPPVILLTTFDDDAALLDGIRLGARGYLLKDVSLQKLTDAIRQVAAGGTLISPVVTERLLQGLQHAPLPPADGYAAEDLTGREAEILRLMTGGYSNREIARALHLSEGTVKNHVSSILSKLGVRDRTRAVLKGIERGLV